MGGGGALDAVLDATPTTTSISQLHLKAVQRGSFGEWAPQPTVAGFTLSGGKVGSLSA